VSMLVAAVSAALAATAFEPRKPSTFAPAIGVIAIVIAVGAWGARRAARSELTRSGDPIRVGMIQGNVSLAERSDAGRVPIIFDNYLRRTRQATGDGAQLVIWPEPATPFAFESDPVSAARIRTLAQQARVPILLGSDQILPAGKGIPTRYYNSAYLVRADG